MLDLDRIEADAKALGPIDVSTSKLVIDLCARVRELESALKPFAPIPEVIAALADEPNTMQLFLYCKDWEVGPVTIGDLRRARSVLVEDEAIASRASSTEFKIGDRVQVRDRRDGAIVYTGTVNGFSVKGQPPGYLVLADDRDISYVGFSAVIPARCVEPFNSKGEN